MEIQNIINSFNKIDNTLCDLLRPILIQQAYRLYFLLWDKNSKYQGPLHDGFQKKEWISIILIVEDWFLECYIKSMEHPNNLEQLNKFIYDNPSEIINFCIDLLFIMIEDGYIPCDDKEGLIIFLRNNVLFYLLRNHLTDVIQYLERKLTSCFCSKNLKKQMKLVSEYDGLKSTTINNMIKNDL